MSLQHLVPALETALGASVVFAADSRGPAAAAAVIDALQPGQVALLENTRFYPGEEKNDPALVAEMAALGDIFLQRCVFRRPPRPCLNHRIGHGPTRLRRSFDGGRACSTRGRAWRSTRPVIAVVGGAKVSTKLDLLSNLVEKVDTLVIGGGMANTFLAAQGVAVGKSLAEHDMTDTASAILSKAGTLGCKILLPSDIVVACEFAANAPHDTLPVSDCPEDAMILDAGPASVARVKDALGAAKTLIWNGPLGAFELTSFDAATNAAAQEAAQLTQAGSADLGGRRGRHGGSVERGGRCESFTYVSTAGGAFLEWMEGKTLPGVAAWRLATHNSVDQGA